MKRIRENKCRKFKLRARIRSHPGRLAKANSPTRPMIQFLQNSREDLDGIAKYPCKLNHEGKNLYSGKPSHEGEQTEQKKKLVFAKIQKAKSQPSDT